ncbi:MAG: tRNA (N(6)-L-threonylcarbamoyladenosine(37)-C(2))-methylthiotransferase MtaB, partial [Spirochaetaceae bacterium]|nr:tRNA (N(6)-L-threonylcarbamoyladenosine(37)-C(2))-methylthiotransferase MtaB [Spirochaetaceae bacterium]
MYTVHFETLGCKLNQIETESAAQLFAAAGIAVTMGGASLDTLSDAQNETLSPLNLYPLNRLCIVNTCTVTGKAEQKARRLIRNLITRVPEASVIVTGCYAELEPAEIRSLGERVAVVPGSAKDTLAELPSVLEAAGASCAQPLPPEDFFSLLQSWTEQHSGATSSNTAVEGDRASSKSRFTLSTDDFIRHSRASVKIQDGCGNK